MKPLLDLLHKADIIKLDGDLVDDWWFDSEDGHWVFDLRWDWEHFTLTELSDANFNSETNEWKVYQNHQDGITHFLITLYSIL